MNISNDLIGNRSRDLPAYSIVPESTTLPRVPVRQQQNSGLKSNLRYGPLLSKLELQV
jgi:hypothetical protein